MTDTDKPVKKYEFTGETKVEFGITFRRIRALITIPGVVAAGSLGGWLQHESNLSQVFDYAWVFGDALVFDKARVFGKAQVFGDARVFGKARVTLTPIAKSPRWMARPARGSGRSIVWPCSQCATRRIGRKRSRRRRRRNEHKAWGMVAAVLAKVME